MTKITKNTNKVLRKNRIRSTLIGTQDRPRLTVTVSLNHVSAQIIDDSSSKTLASATTVNSKNSKMTMTEKAVWVGAEIAKSAKKAKVSKVALIEMAKSTTADKSVGRGRQRKRIGVLNERQ